MHCQEGSHLDFNDGRPYDVRDGPKGMYIDVPRPIAIYRRQVYPAHGRNLGVRAWPAGRP